MEGREPSALSRLTPPALSAPRPVPPAIPALGFAVARGVRLARQAVSGVGARRPCAFECMVTPSHDLTWRSC